MENENVANTVEMAASSSKLLQIAWKLDRSGNPKNNLNGKNTIPKTIPDPERSGHASNWILRLLKRARNQRHTPSQYLTIVGTHQLHHSNFPGYTGPNGPHFDEHHSMVFLTNPWQRRTSFIDGFLGEIYRKHPNNAILGVGSAFFSFSVKLKASPVGVTCLGYTWIGMMFEKSETMFGSAEKKLSKTLQLCPPL